MIWIFTTILVLVGLAVLSSYLTYRSVQKKIDKFCRCVKLPWKTVKILYAVAPDKWNFKPVRVDYWSFDYTCSDMIRLPTYYATKTRGYIVSLPYLDWFKFRWFSYRIVHAKIKKDINKSHTVALEHFIEDIQQDIKLFEERNSEQIKEQLEQIWDLTESSH